MIAYHWFVNHGSTAIFVNFLFFCYTFLAGSMGRLEEDRMFAGCDLGSWRPGGYAGAASRLSDQDLPTELQCECGVKNPPSNMLSNLHEALGVPSHFSSVWVCIWVCSSNREAMGDLPDSNPLASVRDIDESTKPGRRGRAYRGGGPPRYQPDLPTDPCLAPGPHLPRWCWRRLVVDPPSGSPDNGGCLQGRETGEAREYTDY